MVNLFRSEFRRSGVRAEEREVQRYPGLATLDPMSRALFEQKYLSGMSRGPLGAADARSCLGPVHPQSRYPERLTGKRERHIPLRNARMLGQDILNDRYVVRESHFIEKLP